LNNPQNKKIVAIHQPNYMPWIGYFDKIAKSDVFVIIDHVQFVKGHIINRNKIKNDKGEAVWLTTPVKLSKGSFQKINEIEIDYSQNWQLKQVNLIKAFYIKAKYFDSYIDEVIDLLKTKYENIAKLNIKIIKYFCEQLGIKTPIYIASELEQDFGEKNWLNINICKYFQADLYLSGEGARKYNDKKLFQENGIELIYQTFVHPEYPQCSGGFLPNLSSFDLLLNYGPESKKYF